MEPFEQNFDKPIPSHEFDPLQKSGDHSDGFNDYFSQKPSKINDTIDFLNAEIGRAHEVVSSGLVDISDSTKKVENLVVNLDDDIQTEVDKISENAKEEVSKRFEENDLLGLSDSVVNHKGPTLEPVKPETTHVFPASDQVKDLLFDEKEQDELKGFDQYTSDSNASLKVNLSCENDDTASTKSIDSAQSIPLDEKKTLLKENLIEDAPDVLSKISEDTLVNSPKVSSPSPKESKSFVDNFESDFPSQEFPQPVIDLAVKPTSLDHEELIENKVPNEKDVPKEIPKEKEVPKVKENKIEEVPKSEPMAPKIKAPPVKKAVSTEMFIGPHEVFSRFGLGKFLFKVLCSNIIL